MIYTRHFIDTANPNNYTLAKAAADKAGIEFHIDYRANCFKSYHMELIARTFDQDAILTQIILATVAHPEQDSHRKWIAAYIAG